MKDNDLLGERTDRLHLFLLTLQLSLDPSHETLGVHFQRTLHSLFTLLLDENHKEDSTILRTMMKLLFSKNPTTKRAVIDNIPSTTIRSRAFQRCLAHHLVLDHSSPDFNDNIDDDNRYDISLSDYSTLAEALSSNDATMNPILATEVRDYKQLEANVQMIVYCFNDLALQLLAPTSSAATERQQTSSARGSFKKTIQHILDNDEGHYFAEILQTKDTEDFRISHVQIDSLHRIMDAVQYRCSQIQDGKGAFLDRSKVKDQLQRLKLLLSYQLGSFSLAGTKTQNGFQQGTLSKWFVNN